MTVSRKLTIREIAEELNIAYGSAQDIFVNYLGLRFVAAKLVPKDLNFMQKRDCVDVAKDMLSRHQASEWRLPNEPRPTKTTSFSVEKEGDAYGFHGLQRCCAS